jgi:predicted DsbA family dithiol-disulfide isomerase
MSETLFDIISDKDRRTPTAALHVEVIADFVCPFCFLGKRRFDQALEAVQGPAEVSWYPFQLNPDIPLVGQAFDAYLTQRFGDPANVEPVLEHLIDEGRRDGIQFDFDRIRHVPNTLPVHQLMQQAQNLGIDQSALADEIMSAFFEQGRNIGDLGVLLEIGARHGVPGAKVREAVGSDQLRQVVVTREAQVRSSGLTAAPGFLVNRRLLVVGAQPTEYIVSAFDRAMFGKGTDALVSPALH